MTQEEFNKHTTIKFTIDSTMKDCLPTLYGVITKFVNNGVFQAYCIDGNDGTIIKATAGNPISVQSDLGFIEPSEAYVKLMSKGVYEDYMLCNTVNIRSAFLACYREMYPFGYTLEWIGVWDTNPKVKELMTKNIHLYNGIQHGMQFFDLV